MARTIRTTPSQRGRASSDRANLVAQLREVLGVDQRRAQRLLEDTGGDFDAAVGLHFAQGDAEPGPSAGRSRPSSRESELRQALNGMGLAALTPTQAKRLLGKVGNSVDGAVELYLSNPAAAGAPSAAERRTEEVVLLDSTSQEDAGDAEDEDGSDSDGSEGAEEEEESEEEEAALAPPAAAQDEAAPPQDVAGYVVVEDAETSNSYDSFGNASSGFDSGNDDEGEEGPLGQAARDYDIFFNLTAIQHPAATTDGTVPSLDDAVYENARRGPAPTAGLALPLPHLRDRRGRLAAPSSADVPRRVEPDPDAALDPSEPLLLGSIDLPLHAINRKALARVAVAEGGGPLEWTPTSALAYSYVLPSRHPYARSYAEDLSGLISRARTVNSILHGKMPVQLSLGSRRLSDAAFISSSTPEEAKLDRSPVATVRKTGSWVNQVLGAVGILNILGAVQMRYVLVDDVHGEHWTLEGAKRAMPKAQRIALSTKTITEEKAQAQRELAAATEKLMAEDWEAPKAVRAEVWLTPAALEHFSETVEGEVPLGLRGLPTDEVKKLKFWSKCSPALAHLLSALLTRGRGLRAGPDCDGLLNYCDSEPAELAAADAAPPAQIRKAFNVKNLLDSVALPPAKQLGPNVATVSLPRPTGLISTPKRYQLAGLKWMLDRERKGDALGRGHAKLHPAWLQLLTPNTAENGDAAAPRLFYVHRMRTHALSANFYTAPPVGTCGGCICDEMGLGKTLQTLMLVVENPPPSGWAERKIDSTFTVSHENPIPIKTTLLVAPTTLLGQWEDEIRKHLAPRKIRWGRYVNPLDGAAMRALRDKGGVWFDDDDGAESEWETGAGVPRGTKRRPVRARKAAAVYNPPPCAAAPGSKGKKGKGTGGAAAAAAQPAARRPGTAFTQVLCALPSGAAAPIESLDLCLCSYEDLRDQLASGVGSRLSALQQFGFWRVCLDEAQMVANSTSVAAIMASSLWRRHAWCVTGTPVSSNLSEIRGLLEFLALEPVFETDSWGLLVQHGVTDASPRGLGVLRALLRGVMLRRSKSDVADELGLPPCTREDLPVVLSTVERTSYERLKREFLEAVRQLRRHQDAATHAQRTSEVARTASRTASRALAALTALRQSTAHPQLAHGGAAVGPASQRLSMAEIIDRLVAHAYGEYDSAVRALAERRLLAAAAQVASSGSGSDANADPIDAAFSPLIAFLDRASAVAGLFLLERNNCPSLRDAEGEVIGGEAAMAAVATAAAVDAEEAAAEDAEIQKAREEYTAQLLQIAKEWDLAHPELIKPKNKKKKKGAAAAKTGGGGGGAGAKRKRGAAVESKGRSKKKARGRRGVKSEEEEEEEWDIDDASDEEAEAAAADGADSDGDGEYRPQARGDDDGAEDLMEIEEHHAVEDVAGGSGEGAAAKPKGPSMKGRRFARRQVGTRPELEPRRHALRREAAARRRAWERLKLSALELILHLRKEEAGLVVGKWSAAAKRAASGRSKSGALDGLWEAAEAAVEAQRVRLGLDPSAAAAAAAGGVDALRRSRRQAGIDAASALEVILDPEEIREQLENSVIIVRTYKDAAGGRDPVHQAAGHAATAASEASAAYHRLQFVVEQHATAAREAAHAAGAGTSTAVAQEDPNTCPICLDALEENTLAITRCSHKFCGPCIRETLARESPAPCPICRTPLREQDLYEAMSAEEAAVAARAAAATNQMTGEYGAKVAAVLDIVATLADTEGPEAKAVVFSSWGRALRFVGDALAANGVTFAALAGAAAAKRAALLHDFLNSPNCRVLLVLMSNSGGAAGLTLTAATTAILLEPCVNPGLEAQAAARIHRLGQTRPTRVVRLLAEDTVDAAVVEQQRWKVAAGDAAGVAADEVDHGTVAAIADMLSKGTGASPAAGADGAGPSGAQR